MASHPSKQERSDKSRKGQAVAEKASPVTVLVVGSRGYVGPGVVKELGSTGCNVFEVDAGWFSDASGLPKLLRTDVRQWSLRELESIPDTVIYLAAVSNDPAGEAFRSATYAINQLAAVSLALEAKKLGVRRFIFASSCSVYGNGDEDPRTEQHPAVPLTDYAKSKVAAERGLMEIADSQFKVIALRFATACGWSPNLRLDLVLNDFVATALDTGRVLVKSDGTPWRPLIHVQDMARACVWAALYAEVQDFLVLNVGSSGFTHNIGDIARTVAQMTGTEVHFNNRPDLDARSYVVDFGLFNRMARNFQPKQDLESTTQELITRLAPEADPSASYRQRQQYARLPALQKKVLANELNAENLLPTIR